MAELCSNCSPKRSRRACRRARREDLERLVVDGLKAAGLAFDRARAFATPRRLTLVVDGLPAAQRRCQRGKARPARRRARAGDRRASCKGAGLASLDQAEKRDTGKGEFWFAVIDARRAAPTAEVLPGDHRAAMMALPWPKSMRWGSGTLRWVRPLQSHRRAVRRQGAAGRGRPGGDDGADRGSATPRAAIASSHGRASRSRGFADYAAKLRAAHVVLDPARAQADHR